MKRTIAVCLMLLLVAAGCSSPTSDANRPLTGAGEKDGKGKGGGKNNAKKKGKRGGLPGRTGAGGGAAAAPEAAASIDTDVPGADEEKQYPNSSAELVESEPDAKSQGITPDYAEMTGLSIEGLGKQFRVTMSFAGDLPQAMPNDKTIMVVGLQIIRDEDEGYAFAGQCTQKGWTPYAGGKDKQSKFPGSFEIQGNQIIMVIPWSYLDGAYPFKWVSTSNWFQSLANTTHYKFDLIPNKNQANYPG